MGESAKKEPWDQIQGESPEAYALFLVYRNYGMKRSLRKAYCRYLQMYDGYTGSHRGLHLPGNWHEYASTWFWSQRASAWDVRNLTSYGARLAVLHVRAVTTIAEKCVRAAARLSPGDDGWMELLESVKLVGGYLTPEVVRGIQERQPLREPVRVGPGDDGPPVE